jgi:hypothetical protein
LNEEIMTIREKVYFYSEGFIVRIGFMPKILKWSFLTGENVMF